VIFLDTNVVSEGMRARPDPGVLEWLDSHDSDIVLASVVIAEIAYGIERVRPDQRAARLEQSWREIRAKFAGRIFPFDEEAAIIYGGVMGSSERRGRKMATPDGMIAAIALRHQAPLATRNMSHFDVPGLRLIDPWR
jgi:predicted nucleic acid-binding protein